MARNIVKDYIDYDKNFLKEYINIITEKKLSSKLVDMIIETYVNIRYFDMYDHVKRNTIDDIEYYVIENYKKISDRNRKKNILLIADALIVVRYVFLVEKYVNNKSVTKNLESYEEKLKNKYDNSKMIVSNLIKDVKDNNHKKEKFINKLLSNDFSVVKNDTNIPKVYDLYLDTSVKIPDLFSEVAINRVYNSGVIYEDRMMVLYLLTTREMLVDMINYDYYNYYLVSFPGTLLDKKNKLNNLFKVIDGDYLKERTILKVLFSEYLEKKDDYDKLIHSGYSFAVDIDIDLVKDTILLNIFAYIIVHNEHDKKLLEREFDNIIVI